MEWIVALGAGVTGGIGLGWWMASRAHAHRAPAQPAQNTVPDSPWPKERPYAPPKPQPDAGARQVRPRDTSSVTIQAPKALDPEQRRQRIRDRYVAARFAGALKDAHELQDPSKVIKAARLYFEDENNARGDELLRLAIAAGPQETRLWLARLEILFLARNAERYVEVARAFQRAHPGDEHWPEITHLGRALAPGEPLFFGRTGSETDRLEHYGPWPNTPNWIEAPWDLTGEIAGTDFHRRMRGKMQRLLASRPRTRQAAAR